MPDFGLGPHAHVQARRQVRKDRRPFHHRRRVIRLEVRLMLVDIDADPLQRRVRHGVVYVKRRQGGSDGGAHQVLVIRPEHEPVARGVQVRDLIQPEALPIHLARGRGGIEPIGVIFDLQPDSAVSLARCRKGRAGYKEGRRQDHSQQQSADSFPFSHGVPLLSLLMFGTGQLGEQALPS